MPEEEYYTSQGVRNTKSYFETPNGKLFTQSFLPLDDEIKGTVYMSHGYGSDTSWIFQKVCISFSTWGYAVFAADILGHGRSDGIRCYMGDMEKVAATSLCFFKHVRCSELYKHLPAFLFGELLGGLATLLMYFQSEPDTWTGLIFSAPLFVIPEDMKPSKAHLFAYGSFLVWLIRELRCRIIRWLARLSVTRKNSRSLLQPAKVIKNFFWKQSYMMIFLA